MTDRPPALEGVSTSEVVANTLNLIHANRRAYIECESSDKLRRAMRHQIRPFISQKYNNGDRVIDSWTWYLKTGFLILHSLEQYLDIL